MNQQKSLMQNLTGFFSLPRKKRHGLQPGVSRSETTVEKVDQWLEDAAGWLRKELGEHVLQTRLNSFFGQFGKVFPEDEGYGARMNYFLEWLVLSSQSTSPFSLFLDKEVSPSYEVQDELSFHTGLFLIVRKRERELWLKNLLSGEFFLVKARPQESFVALDRLSILQGMVVDICGSCFLGKGLIIHPKSSLRWIKKFLKGSSPEDLSGSVFSKLSQVQLRHCRQPRVPVRTFYSALVASAGTKGDNKNLNKPVHGPKPDAYEKAVLAQDPL